MKQTLSTVKAIVIFALLLNFSCVFSQMVKLPNMHTLTKRISAAIDVIPGNTVEPRNYKLNFREKSYYNITLGDFVSDHKLSIQEDGNELAILTNSQGECWGIIDYVSVNRKDGPYNEQFKIIANKLYSDGTWILGRIDRYEGIYCNEGNIIISIYYTGDNLVVRYVDKSLKSPSIVDEFLVFNSMGQFVAYQDTMGANPSQRQAYSIKQRQAKEDKIESLRTLEANLGEERKSLMASIDSVNNIFSNIRKAVLSSTDLSVIASYMDSIPELDSYQLLRDGVDKYNDKALALNANTEVKLYANPIEILNSIKMQSGFLVDGNQMFKYDYYEYRVNSSRDLVAKQQEKVKADRLAQAKSKKESEDKKKILQAKYGAAYARYVKEGYYTGMSFDLVKDVTGILLSKGFVNGMDYFEGPFKFRFGFKNKKLVYFSGYLN